MCQKLNQPIWLFTYVFGKRTQKRFKIEKFAIKVHIKNLFDLKVFKKNISIVLTRSGYNRLFPN